MTLDELQSIGRITNDHLNGEQGMKIGQQSLTIQIPNFEGWTYTTFLEYPQRPDVQFETFAGPKMPKLAERQIYALVKLVMASARNKILLGD